MSQKLTLAIRIPHRSHTRTIPLNPALYPINHPPAPVLNLPLPLHPRIPRAPEPPRLLQRARLVVVAELEAGFLRLASGAARGERFRWVVGEEAFQELRGGGGILGRCLFVVGEVVPVVAAGYERGRYHRGVEFLEEQGRLARSALLRDHEERDGDQIRYLQSPCFCYSRKPTGPALPRSSYDASSRPVRTTSPGQSQTCSLSPH